MKAKEILIEMVEYLSDYQGECEETEAEMNMTDFLGFLNGKHKSLNVKTRGVSGDSQDYQYEEKNGPATDISILIVLMFRYAKGYIKKALKDSPIKSADEFSFLMTLLTYDDLTKSELIQKQVMEKTSGSEIINRLVKLGLMEQFNDEADKRSIRIKITAQGKVEIVKILPEMQKVSKIVIGNLNEPERNTLAYLLRKLEHFHNDIFHTKKDIELDKLIQNEEIV